MKGSKEVYELLRKEIGVGPKQSYKGFIQVLSQYAEAYARIAFYTNRYNEEVERAGFGCEHSLAVWTAKRDIEICEKYMQIWRDYGYVPLDVYERATDLIENYILENFK